AGACVLSANTLLSDHAHVAHSKLGARARPLGGTQPLRRLGGVQAKTVPAAGLGAHPHDVALVPRALGGGARPCRRRYLRVGLQEEPARARDHAALRAPPGVDAAAVRAGRIVLAVDARDVNPP